MPIFNRPYMRENGHRQGGGSYTFGLPKPPKVVRFLLIANLAVFVLQIASQAMHRRGVGFDPISSVFGVTVGGFWQVWRYITFQFLHDTGSLWHIALNLLGICFLGAPLETHWGPRKFLAFYLSCGVLAGVAYVVMGAALGLDPTVPIIGASGGVYGIVLACAVLFPQFRIIFLFFPVPIRLAAVIIFGGMFLGVLSSISRGIGAATMSDVAHLGGAVAAVLWLWAPRLAGGAAARSFGRIRRGMWERKMRAAQDQQEEIDRILRKVHDEGINSLTDKERKTLRDATAQQRQSDRELYRL